MHYYKRNLGDYAKKAGRLSMLQHGSYTLLIDACYDREQFPTYDEAIEWTWASTTEEIEAVAFVLRKFFELQDGVYVQNRIKEEIDEYHAKAEKNKQIAIERETKRKEKSTVRALVDNESSPNHKPITNNHKPITKDKSIAPDGDYFLGIDPQLVADFKAMRSKHRAPITKTAMDGIRREAQKANIRFEDALKMCCERSWRGFKAEWVSNGFSQVGSMQAKPEKFDPTAYVNRNKVKPDDNIIDIN